MQSHPAQPGPIVSKIASQHPWGRAKRRGSPPGFMVPSHPSQRKEEPISRALAWAPKLCMQSGAVQRGSARASRPVTGLGRPETRQRPMSARLGAGDRAAAEVAQYHAHEPEWGRNQEGEHAEERQEDAVDTEELSPRPMTGSARGRGMAPRVMGPRAAKRPSV